jgi:membrane-bound ClpP family serine protease
MGTQLVWPILSLVVALLLFLAEAFIPSGGLIGMLAVGFVGVSLYLAFTTTTLGWLFLLVTVVLLPLTFALAVHLWPRTPLAKYLFLKPPEPEEVVPDGQSLLLEHLVGRFGRALTVMRPTGLVDFDGRRLEGMSEEGMIPAGALVRAVQARGGRLVVRLADVPALDDVVQ